MAKDGKRDWYYALQAELQEPLEDLEALGEIVGQLKETEGELKGSSLWTVHRLVTNAVNAIFHAIDPNTTRGAEPTRIPEPETNGAENAEAQAEADKTAALVEAVKAGRLQRIIKSAHHDASPVIRGMIETIRGMRQAEFGPANKHGEELREIEYKLEKAWQVASERILYAIDTGQEVPGLAEGGES